MLDHERKRSAGYAFLEFKRPEIAKDFVQQLADNYTALMPNPYIVEFALQDSRKLRKINGKNA